MRTTVHPTESRFGKTQLPPDSDIRQALQPGETLLWQGRPVEGVRVHVSMEIVIFPLIGLTFTSIAAVFLAGMLAAGFPAVFLVIPAPFLLGGIIFLAYAVGLPFLEARRRAKLRYAVTNRRLLVRGPRSLSAYQIRECRGLQVKLYKDGVGTIYTERRTLRGWTRRYIFEEIPDAERVYQLMEQQMAGI